MFATALLIAGAAVAAWKLWTNVLRPGHDLRRRYQKGSARPWALVTGASDGIGKAFCLSLAKRGFNIILVSRTKAKLDAVAEEIQALAEGAKTVVVSIDFAQADFHAVRQTLDDACKGKDVALLVNNAGMGVLPTPLHEIGDAEVKQTIDLIQVNITAFTAVLRAVVPHIVSRDARGGVVNVSSASAFHGLPYNATYAGSKAYNNIVSQTVAAELRHKNIDVLSFTPLFVSTNMVRNKPSLFVATAPAAVEACLRSLGHEDQTSGTLSHKVQTLAASVAPSLLEKAALARMKTVRKKLLAKAAKNQ